jgi:hypothetical protein
MNQTKFPYLESDMSAALQADPILLDGMKVIFDKKAGLTPVEVEKKPGAQNGKRKPGNPRA